MGSLWGISSNTLRAEDMQRSHLTYICIREFATAGADIRRTLNDWAWSCLPSWGIRRADVDRRTKGRVKRSGGDARSIDL